tara:strand:- start:11 stop:175 length:165 start_codon:yes stop_codon:yes gene_type:complete
MPVKLKKKIILIKELIFPTNLKKKLNFSLVKFMPDFTIAPNKKFTNRNLFFLTK